MLMVCSLSEAYATREKFSSEFLINIPFNFEPVLVVVSNRSCFSKFLKNITGPNEHYSIAVVTVLLKSIFKYTIY